MKEDRQTSSVRRQYGGSAGLAAVASNCKPVGRYPADRRCEWPGCTTILARANPDDFCYAHKGRGESLRKAQVDREKEKKQVA